MVQLYRALSFRLSEVFCQGATTPPSAAGVLLCVGVRTHVIRCVCCGGGGGTARGWVKKKFFCREGFYFRSLAWPGLTWSQVIFFCQGAE